VIRFPLRAVWIPLGAAIVVLAGCGGTSSAGTNATPTAQTAQNAATPNSATSLTPQTIPTQAVPPTAVISGGSTAAVVNGQKVPMSAFRLLYNFTIQQYAGSPQVNNATVAKQALDQVVRGTIAKQYAASHGITVSADDENRIVQQQEARYGGAKGFETALAHYGLTITTFKQLIEPSLYEQKVAQKVVPIKPVMEQVARVRHILVGTTLNGKPLRSDAAAKTRAENVLNQLKHGASFATLAAKYSDDPGSAKSGGYYTVHPHDQYVPQFLNASFAEPVGKLTIVKSQFGYHVFQVVSRHKAPAPASEQQQLQQQRFTVWMNSQEAHAKVQRIATVK